VSILGILISKESTTMQCLPQNMLQHSIEVVDSSETTVEIQNFHLWNLSFHNKENIFLTTKGFIIITTDILTALQRAITSKQISLK